MYDIFVVTQQLNLKNIQRIKEKYPHTQIVKYNPNRIDQIKNICQMSVTEFAWVLDESIDYSQFNLEYQPPWHQADQLHVWASGQQTQGGDTILVNTKEFLKQADQLDSIQNYQLPHWHTETAGSADCPDIVVFDFGGQQHNVEKIKSKYPDAKVLRYFGTHLDMMKKAVNYVSTKSFWVLSSCCEYSDFDPSWKPAWQDENSIHCWASGSQAFGDTFYVPTFQWKEQMDNIEKLEYYNNIVWHKNGYNRLPWPVNYSKSEDLFTTLKTHKFTTLYEYFVMPGSKIGSTVEPSLWEKRLLIAYNKNGHVSLCPRDCISQISDKVRDYPYIQYHKCEISKQKPQDIVFISYDEKNADLNYKILKNLFPHAKRVHGVKGNVMAYKEAAKLSSTPWYYAVFPKTEIDLDFGFDHHPDYLERPGHYIFNAHNRITDLVYGHGGVKMYHVKTTIEIENWGFDFTLSSPVTVIPVNSCYLEPATAYEAWRTSFREALKLKNDNSIESKYRLHCWLTVGNGKYGNYSKEGAAAALEYNGDTKIANSWEWLREQFDSRYS